MSLIQALQELTPNAEWSCEDTYSSIVWHNLNGDTKPSESVVNSKVTEINNAKPMVELRKQRDSKLSECDWVVIKALESNASVASNWKTYRQALRDLPSSANPQLDSEDNLTNVTWPTKPS